MKKPTPPSFFADLDTSRRILKALGWDQLKGKDINCVAMMSYKGKKYWAVNGCSAHRTASKEKIEPLMEVLQGLTYTIVALNAQTPQQNNVKVIAAKPKVYFYKAGTKFHVSYDAYAQKYNTRQPNENFNARLFSCCERKLISAVKHPETDAFTITVIKPPCELCNAAHDWLNNPNFKLKAANLMTVEAFDTFRKFGLV